MSWTTKTIKSPPKEIIKAQLWLIAGATLMNLLATFIAWSNLPKYTPGLISAYILSYSMTIYFILILRQKTIFNYCITRQMGKIEYFRHYPNFAAPMFKYLAIFTVVSFFIAALYTGSFLLLIGPAAMALGAARMLFGWKNEVKHLQSSPWNEYNFVTIDRKRLIIIAHRTNQTIGFEARFPNKQLLDQYLQTLKTVIPTTVTHTEKSWEW